MDFKSSKPKPSWASDSSKFHENLTPNEAINARRDGGVPLSRVKPNIGEGEAAISFTRLADYQDNKQDATDRLPARSDAIVRKPRSSR